MNKIEKISLSLCLFSIVLIFWSQSRVPANDELGLATGSVFGAILLFVAGLVFLLSLSNSNSKKKK